MRRLLFILIITTITITLAACGDSSTGPNPDNDDGGGSSEPTTYSITVDMSPSDAGSISGLKDSYEEGENAQLQANPNAEYVFAGWTGDVESSDNPLSLTINQDYDLGANFELKKYELTINTDGEGAVQEKILEQKSTEYEHGTVVELTANPAEGYKFVEWNGDMDGADNPAQITVDDPKEVTAVFEKKTYPLTITTEGDGAVSEEVVQQKITDYEYGAVVELTANPAEGSEFTEWKGDLSGSDNPVEVTVDDTMEVTAVFEKKTYTVSTSTTGEGTVSLNPDQSEYEYGTTVELTANPENGWEFVEWIDDVEGTENPTEITMDGSKEVTAIFEEESENNFSLHENGVTIVCPDALPGETGEVDGTEYEAVNRMQLDQKITNFADLTTVCTSLITDMSELFDSKYSFNQDLSSWDVSNVTDMQGMFYRATDFNADLNHWDVSNVTDMSRMFRAAESFTGNISSWDVSSLTTMEEMFSGAVSFNGDLSNWDVSNVTTTHRMFYRAENFNSNLNNWDVSKISDMSWMFTQASSFNQDLNTWDVSGVTKMIYIFSNTDSFNGDISSWDVSNLTEMRNMFAYARAFNGDISNWDVSNATDMRRMFYYADNFNGDLSNWDMSNVTMVSRMFAWAANFNGDISSWDMSSVTDMEEMFDKAESFNQDIGSWDVSNVTEMDGLFRYAENFEQDLSGWCVTNITSEPSSFDYMAKFEDVDALQPNWGTCPE